MSVVAVDWLRRALAASLVAAAAVVAAPSHAQATKQGEPGGAPDIRCSDSLPACTKHRVAQLRALARGLGNAAAMKPAEKLEPEERAQLDRFDKWLRANRGEALRLVTMGERAKSEGTQRAFNLQYLALQDSLRAESRRFQSISTIMQKKHEVAMTTIRSQK